MDRRTFLWVAGLTALGACAKPRNPVIAPQPLREVATDVAERSQAGLSVFPGAGEFVEGAQRFPFGAAAGGSAELLAEGPARLWVARGGKPVGPVSAAFRRFAEPGEGDPAGFFVATIDVPRGDGVVDILVEAGGRYGFAVVNPRQTFTVPGVGAEAVSTKTPTVGNSRGVASICTRKPRCPMHAVSLDDALRVGKPVVFTIASPLLCSSRTCGPVLNEVLAVRESAGARAAFVHAEPYAGNTATTLSPAAVSWRIESEPWTFVIGKDGKLAARFEGPVVAAEIDAALKPLL